MRILDRAQRLGLIGSGEDLADHLSHARGFLAADPPAAGEHAVDLGSGNGLPGLALICEWPGSSWWLVESSSSRCEFLRWAVAALDVGARAEVLEGPAERLARVPQFRGQADLVVARAFGPAAVTAECAVGFLRRGGRLVVSEPPEPDPDRWPSRDLAEMGFELADSFEGAVRLQTLVRSGDLPDRYPRREGVPRRRPVF